MTVKKEPLMVPIPPTLEERANASQLQVCATGDQLTLTGPAWSLRWAAPEVLFGDRPDLPRDIWAVGWVHLGGKSLVEAKALLGRAPFV